MALDRSRVDTSYPDYRYEVAREKIREYAAAVGETDPRYFSDGDDCVAPPTFAATFTLARGVEAVLADPDLGAHRDLVHGSQRFVYGSRPLRPGDVLVCTPRIADIGARGRNELLEVEVDCRFVLDGQPAVRSEAVIVFLGSAPSGEGGASPEAGA